MEKDSAFYEKLAEKSMGDVDTYSGEMTSLLDDKRVRVHCATRIVHSLGRAITAGLLAIASAIKEEKEDGKERSI